MDRKYFFDESSLTNNFIKQVFYVKKIYIHIFSYFKSFVEYIHSSFYITYHLYDLIIFLSLKKNSMQRNHSLFVLFLICQHETYATRDDLFRTKQKSLVW